MTLRKVLKAAIRGRGDWAYEEEANILLANEAEAILTMLDLLQEAYQLMPLGTAKRASWIGRVLPCLKGNTE